MKTAKLKNCSKSYPCGEGCISRRFNCRKKLAGQASNYAGWLKLQGEKLGSDFDREAGKRLSQAANSRIKVTRTDRPANQKLFSETFKLLDKADQEILESDRRMLESAKRFLELDIGDAEQNKAEIAQLEKAIAEREKKINAKIPQNQLQAFTRLNPLDQEIFNLTQAQQQLSDSLNSLVQKSAENRIVPFRKRRSRDFNESPDNFFQQYKSLKEQLETAIANLELELELIMMNNA